MSATRTWPPAYLQPDPNRDCALYAQAYIARCLGEIHATVLGVRRYSEATGRQESHYSRDVLGCEYRDYTTEAPDGQWSDARFWLGPGTADWVRSWLADGWIAQCNVHHRMDLGHAVVLLDWTDEGPLLMDPVFGLKPVAADWFLACGPGRGKRGVHRVVAWYQSRPVQPESDDEDPEAVEHRILSHRRPDAPAFVPREPRRPRRPVQPDTERSET